MSEKTLELVYKPSDAVSEDSQTHLVGRHRKGGSIFKRLGMRSKLALASVPVAISGFLVGNNLLEQSPPQPFSQTPISVDFWDRLTPQLAQSHSDSTRTNSAEIYPVPSPAERIATESVLSDYMIEAVSATSNIFSEASIYGSNENGEEIILKEGTTGVVATLEGGNHEILLTRQDPSGDVFSIVIGIDPDWWGGEEARSALPSGNLSVDKVTSLFVSYASSPEYVVGGHLITGLGTSSFGVVGESDKSFSLVVIDGANPEEAKFVDFTTRPTGEKPFLPDNIAATLVQKANSLVALTPGPHY